MKKYLNIKTATALAVASSVLFTGCAEKQKPESPIAATYKYPPIYQTEYNFGQWENPVRQWDNSWVQARYDTNTGYCQMRVVLKGQ